MSVDTDPTGTAADQKPVDGSSDCEGGKVHSAVAEIRRIVEEEIVGLQDSNIEPKKMVNVPLWALDSLATDFALVRVVDIEQLLAELDLANKLYKVGIKGLTERERQEEEEAQGTACDTLHDHGRAGVLVVLNAIRDHLERLGISVDKFLPLVGLISAFLDLETGRTPSLMKAVEIRTRAPYTHSHITVRLWAAVAMDVRMQAGDSRSRAANWVAEKLSRYDTVFHGSSPTTPRATIIAHWRDNFRDGPHDGLLVQNYRININRHKELGISPKIAAERLLDSLPYQHDVRA